MPDSPPSRMSISATSGSRRSISSRPSLAEPAVPIDLAPLAAEQQLEALAERLVVFDEDEGERHERVPTSRKLRADKSMAPEGRRAAV